MKFPKSLHAEGWSKHIDTTPSDKPSVAAAPLHSAKPVSANTRLDTPRSAAAFPATPPIAPTATPRVEPVSTAARPQPRSAAVLPPQRENKLSWMIAAGAGAAVIAAAAIWAMNRSDEPATPPAVLVGSAEPQTEVAAATPAPEVTPPVTPAEETTTVAAVAPPPADEPGTRVGLPVTTSRPAAESRPVAQAPVAAPRPELVERAAPRTPALQPPVTVAAAPAQTPAEVLGVPPGNAPIVMPPTSAGPATTTTPEPLAPVAPQVAPQVIPPVAATTPTAPMTPDVAAPSTSPGMPPLAQAPAQPTAEDSGITMKVRTALASDSTLSAVPISVSTDQGVVKLEGQAPDPQTRERATVVAASAIGVKAVDNRLTVAPTAVLSQAPTSVQ